MPANSHIPMRTCLGCLQKRPKFGMVRIAYKNGRILRVDPEQTHPGRGFYLCPAPECVREFFRKKRYRKVRVSLTQEEREMLERELGDMIQQDKVYSLVGLARKAGKAVFGQEAVERAIKQRQARLVLLATDAAINTRKRFIDLCRQRGVPLRLYGTKSDWGHWMGKESTAILAILHEGFADAVYAEISRSESAKEAGGRKSPPKP
ncbi:MAG TPA: DUF448 domain-containing protein [Bacteroidetes bacterium]|nr:DUF448 domain-containing protein [Bacteroidota bacterium]